jgi:hypothetical protein
MASPAVGDEAGNRISKTVGSRRNGAVDLSPTDVETDLVDLSDISLSTLHLCDRVALSRSVERLLTQVDRPRANLGGNGPPGRVD